MPKKRRRCAALAIRTKKCNKNSNRLSSQKPKSSKQNDVVYVQIAEDGMVPRNVELRLRMAIFYVYMDVFGAPEKCTWKGTDGAIKQIGDFLRLPRFKCQLIARVLSLARSFAEMGLLYSRERQIREGNDNFLIDPSSEETQIIADAMESGFRTTLEESTVEVVVIDLGLELHEEPSSEKERTNLTECQNLVFVDYVKVRTLLVEGRSLFMKGEKLGGPVEGAKVVDGKRVGPALGNVIDLVALAVEEAVGSDETGACVAGAAEVSGESKGTCPAILVSDENPGSFRRPST